MILNQLVWLQVTISLLEDAMLKGGKQLVLIDGFPRNEENRAAFEAQVSPPVILYSIIKLTNSYNSIKLSLCDNL